MKKRLLSILLILSLLLSMLTLTAVSASANSGDGEDDENNIVVSLTAGQNAAYDNYDILANALYKADVSEAHSVTISPAGTFYIASGHGSGVAALKLRSNTTVDLGGSTLLRWGSMGNVFQNCDANGETYYGTGYTMTENITIKNGTIDATGGSTDDINVINLGHATGITIENLTMKNCKGGHLIEFTGCKDCTVSGCTFSGFRANKAGKLDVPEEAVQLDICDNNVSKTQWNGIFYSDSTVCRNITVDGCTFNDYPAGVGNHKGIYGNHNTGIVITNNTFNNTLNTSQPAIWAYDFDSSTISGNTITGKYSEGIKLSACKNTTASNNTITLPVTGIYVTLANSYTRGKVDVTTEEYCSGCNVTGNTVTATGSGTMGVCIYSYSGVSNCNNNTITAPGTALTVSSNSKVTYIKNNTLKSTADSGLLIMTDATAGTVSGNTVTGKLDAILVRSNAVVTNITGNKNVTSSTGNGIYVSSATAKNISSNTVKNCKLNGIQLTSSGKTGKIAFNTVSGCGGYGIRVNNTGITVQYGGNSLTNNTEGKEKLSCKTTEVTELDTPVLKKASAVYGGVDVSWNKTPGAVKYRVYYGNGSKWTKLADTTATSYTDTTAVSGTTIYYTVRCISKDGKTTYSGYDKNGVSIDYVAAPTLKLEGVNKGVKITVSKPAGAEKVRIFVKTSSGWKKLTDTASTTYTHAAATGKTYTYTARALNADGAFVSAYNTTGWKLKYLANPAISKLQNTKSGVQLTISKPSGAEKFRIYIKSGSSWKKLADTTSTTYVHTAAKNGTSYTYTVRCISSNAKQYQSGYNTTGKTIKCKR